MPNFSLFDEFSKTSTESWKKKIEEDLKGVSYDSSLVWKTREGFSVQPFYQREGSSLFKVQKKNQGWLIGQVIVVNTVKGANVNALKAIKMGADCIYFNLIIPDIDFNKLLQSIDLEKTVVYLNFGEVSSKQWESIQLNPPIGNKLKIHVDVLSNLAKTGNWVVSEADDFNVLNKMFSSSGTSNITVDSTLYQNAGATIIQQLAFMLAHANEYLNCFDIGDGQMCFKVAVGSNYFFEIAKLQAIRLLWTALMTEFDLKNECFIIAIPTKRNKTLYDYNVNMLRTTTECMSAVLGGADLVCNLPYDSIYNESNEFGERIALNQLLLLKEESYFNKVENIAEGAYYIEQLTQQFAENALYSFKKIELSGGFLAQLKKGNIQQDIRQSAAEEQVKFNSADEALVGTNLYRNKADRMKEQIKKDPFCKSFMGATSIAPIIECRLSEEIEQERLKNE